MAQKLKKKAGRARYALRKQPVEPTRILNHQVSAELSLVLSARAEEGYRRMDASLPRLEFETYGRIASAVG